MPGWKVILGCAVLALSCGCKIVKNPTDGENNALAMCEALGGNLDIRQEANGSLALCHFPDGTFCAADLVLNGQCEPGRWQYPNNKSDAIEN